MVDSKYDIFISYRRNGGFETSKHLYDLLTKDGYTVSFDIDTLRNGDFDTSLLKRIEECSDFILIIDVHTFDRTLDPTFPPQKDWLRQELAHALKHNKNIIPIMLAGVTEFPSTLPNDINSVVKKNGPEYSRYYFDEFYETLKTRFLTSTPAQQGKSKHEEIQKSFTEYPKPNSAYNLPVKYKGLIILLSCLIVALILSLICFGIFRVSSSNDHNAISNSDVESFETKTTDRALSNKNSNWDDNIKSGEESPNIEIVPNREIATPKEEKSVSKEDICHFSGLFNYRGCDYHFDLIIVYDKDSEVVREVKYKPDYSNTYSVINGDAYFVKGEALRINGASVKSNIPLSISANRGNGNDEYSGQMMRGDNEGTCTLVMK